MIKQQMDDIFEQQIKELGTSLFHYIFSFVKHKELAEDLHQEVLISAYTAFDSFQKKASFKSWIFTIAKNQCYDYWRKEKNAQRFWQESVYEYTTHTESVQVPETIVVEKSKQEEVIHKIKELPGKYREPILLFYFQQCSILEISQQTETPPATVKTRMRRAKAKLRPKVQKLVIQ